MTQAKKSLADDTGFARAWSTLFGEYRGGARLLGLHGLEDAARVRALSGHTGVAEAYELMRAILGTQTAVLISRLEHEEPLPQIARLTPPGAIEHQRKVQGRAFFRDAGVSVDAFEVDDRVNDSVSAAKDGRLVELYGAAQGIVRGGCGEGCCTGE